MSFAAIPSLELIAVPGGSFLMGCETGRDEEQPVHRVCVDEFLLGVFPVRNRDYRAFLEASGHPAPPLWSDANFSHPDQPVAAVSWFEAVEYCDWLSGVTGKSYRLPTEAEWERAARGAEGRKYPWGEEEPDPSRANYEKTGVGAPTPVGLFPRGATPNGICDMAGNVWEWVADWYGKYPKEKQQNPKGPSSGEMRVLRGGAWSNVSRFLRGADRLRGGPGGRSVSIGFRCTREVLFP